MEGVDAAEARQHVVGEGVAAHHHPRIAPDGHRHARTAGGRGSSPHGAGRREPVGLVPAQGRVEQAFDRVERLVDRPDPGHPHGHAGRAQAPDVELAVLLLVGDDQIGGEGDDRRGVGVLGAADRGDVQGRPGTVHQSVAATTESRRLATSASVSDGTRLTTRRAGCDTATTCPRSSTADRCCIPGRLPAAPPAER